MSYFIKNKNDKTRFFAIFFLLLSSWTCEDNGDNDDYNINGIGIVINEINYNSSESFDPEDWIEIYNNTSETVDIGLWLLKDEEDDHTFTVPSNTLLLPDEYLVFCKDTLSFISSFPDVVKFIGNMDFGLGGGGDVLRLFDQNGSLVDIVEYEDQDPWPVSADGGGPTLELKNPNLDNSISENWSASENFGTPGEMNSVYLNE